MNIRQKTQILDEGRKRFWCPDQFGQRVATAHLHGDRASVMHSAALHWAPKTTRVASLALECLSIQDPCLLHGTLNEKSRVHITEEEWSLGTFMAGLPQLPCFCWSVFTVNFNCWIGCRPNSRHLAPQKLKSCSALAKSGAWAVVILEAFRDSSHLLPVKMIRFSHHKYGRCQKPSSCRYYSRVEFELRYEAGHLWLA